MFTAGLDGSDMRVVDPSGRTSHFIWRDPKHICAWTRPAGKPSGFYVFEDGPNPNPVLVGEGAMTVNGHNTYVPLPGRQWILCDTYPNRDRQQTLYLYHVPTRRRIDLGRFYLPPEYRGEWRCDLHPRSCNNGRAVAIDSPHTGAGRQVHLLDISDIVG
jgi:hypothetical protein